jgi:predicted HicB family RNase H-like nuclease
MHNKLDKRLVVMIDAATYARIAKAAKKAKISLGQYVRERLA